MFVKSSRYCRTKIVSKYGNLIFYQRRFFACRPFWKANLTEMFVKSGRYCRKQMVSKYENFIFYHQSFLHGGHIGSHFGKKNWRRCSCSSLFVYFLSSARNKYFNFLNFSTDGNLSPRVSSSRTEKWEKRFSISFGFTWISLNIYLLLQPIFLVFTTLLDIRMYVTAAEVTVPSSKK